MIKEIINRDHACPLVYGIGIGIGIEVEIGMGIVAADYFGRVMCHICVMCLCYQTYCHFICSMIDDPYSIITTSKQHIL